VPITPAGFELRPKPVGEYARWPHAVEAAKTSKAVKNLMESPSYLYSRRIRTRVRL